MKQDDRRAREGPAEAAGEDRGLRRDRPEAAGASRSASAASTTSRAKKCSPACRRPLLRRTMSIAWPNGPPGSISTGRRTAFANWVTSPENPLFARVMVNRIWQHHFGTGLVDDARQPRRFGRQAVAPGIARLSRRASSCSRVEREGAASADPASAVYRQIERATREDLETIDPDNRLLGRFPLRRLDAEAVRDAMLEHRRRTGLARRAGRTSRASGRRKASSKSRRSRTAHDGGRSTCSSAARRWSRSCSCSTPRPSSATAASGHPRRCRCSRSPC